MPERGWRRTIRVRTLPDKVAGKGMALSGFSFGAMVFALGFFSGDIQNSGPLVLSLLTSSILFLVAAETADYSVKFWELFVAEVAYMAAAFIMFAGLLWFLWAKFSFFGWSPLAILALPIVLYSIFLINTVRTVVNVKEITEGPR